jgi:hypothetical protein
VDEVVLMIEEVEIRGGAGFGPGRAAARPKIFTFTRDIYIFVNYADININERYPMT